VMLSEMEVIYGRTRKGSAYVKATENRKKPCLHERRGIVLHLYFVGIAKIQGG